MKMEMEMEMEMEINNMIMRHERKLFISRDDGYCCEHWLIDWLYYGMKRQLLRDEME